MKKAFLFTAVSLLVFHTCGVLAQPNTSNPAVASVISKVQKKPLRTQELFIEALKKAQNRTDLSSDQLVLLREVENGLRKKTPTGELLATSLERKSLLSSMTSSNAKQTGSATLSIQADLSSEVDPAQAVSLDAELSADVDLHDISHPRIRVRGILEADSSEGAIDVAGEVRVIDTMGYVLLEKFSLRPAQPFIGDMIDPYIGTWWKVPVDTSEVESLEIDIKEQQSQQQDIVRRLSQANLIPSLTYHRSSQGVVEYSGDVSSKALEELIVSMSPDMSIQDRSEMSDFLSSIDTRITLRQDAGKKTISEASVFFVLDGSGIQEISGTIRIDMMSSDSVGPIQVPTGAQVLEM